MENLTITTGIAKICDHYGKKIYQDFLRFDDETEIYIHNLGGLYETVLSQEENITDIQETFIVKTICKETLAHELILNLERIPDKKNILETIKYINTFIQKKHNL
tara:strand:- start:2 stop:316 length:315 start_codon:yes stop_codon:yes gene_type:complete